MIKTLKLVNWQTHSLLELNFQEGLNVIYGHTDSGKSSIVRALRWILFDDFSSSEGRKQDTKSTSVTVIFDSDIEVTRIKSNSINAYEVKKGKEVKRYDAIGKGIPEEIQKIFGMELFEVDGMKINLNIAEQLSAPFLLGKEYPSTFKAKLFNQLTGNDLQDKLFKDLNKEVLGFGRDISTNEKLIEDSKKELEVLLGQRDTVNKKYESVQNLLFFIEDLNEKKESYLSVSKGLTTNNIALILVKKGLESLKIIQAEIMSALKENIASLEGLKAVKTRLVGVNGSINEVQGQVSQIKTPDLKFDLIYDQIKRLDSLKALNLQFKNNHDKNRDILTGQKELELRDQKNQNELQELKSKFISCPVCEKVIAKEDIEKLKVLQ